jgi:hypothetical protein
MTEGRPPGREVSEGQKHGLYVYDRAVEGEDGKRCFGVRLDNGDPACCSKLAGKDRLCEAQILFDNGRCKKHGGKSLRGVASPSWKHGRHSLVSAPTALRDYYDKWLTDPELIHHRHEAAMVMGMLEDLLANNEEGGTPALWKRLRELAETMEAARRAKNYPKMEETWQKIRVILERGVDQAERERRILSLAESARRHKDSELKRKTIESNTFTVEEAAAYYTALGAAVRRHVVDPTKTDQEKLRAISNDMAAIAGRRGVSTPPPRDEAE